MLLRSTERENVTSERAKASLAVECQPTRQNRKLTSIQLFWVCINKLSVCVLEVIMTRPIYQNRTKRLHLFFANIDFLERQLSAENKTTTFYVTRPFQTIYKTLILQCLKITKKVSFFPFCVQSELLLYLNCLNFAREIRHFGWFF